MDEELKIQQVAPLQANPPQLHTFLQLVGYPATKQEILHTGFTNAIGDRDLHFLNTLPDQEYTSLAHLLITLEDILDF